MPAAVDPTESDIQPRLTRFPGRARPRGEALKEAQEQVRKRREQVDPVLWSLLVPDPESHFRWRVQLDCDCIVELYTYGDDQPPHEAAWIDPSTGFCLRKGEVPCYHPTEEPAPYRAITLWISRREMTFPADAAECPPDEDAEIWRLLHRAEPSASAFWRVELECGHEVEACTALDWDPSGMPKLVSAERQAEMTAELEELWRTDPPSSARDVRDREHYQRMLAQGWPRPFPEHDCWSCQVARRIVAYQKVGWLVPRPKPFLPPQPDKEAIRRRLEKAEAKTRRLRKQLEDLD